MSEQTKHAVRQWFIMLAVAALGFLVTNQTQILNDIGVPETWQPVIVAFLATAVRWVEGLRDASRNKNGELIPSDVGYETVIAAEDIVAENALIDKEFAAAPPLSSQRFVEDPFGTH